MHPISRRQFVAGAGAAAAALSPLSLLTATNPALGKGPRAGEPGKLIVHEWGTFLSVQGSDGVTLGGMVASEEVLPSFVESRSIVTWDRTRTRAKMETPVTYFYTDRPRVVDVRVEMPQGILTHWFPMVRTFGPALSAENGTPPAPSFLHWTRVQLLPLDQTYRSVKVPKRVSFYIEHEDALVLKESGDQLEVLQQDGQVVTIAKSERILPGAPILPMLWRVKSDDTWRFARDTDAAVVRVHSRSLEDWFEYDCEKFLFYRGLGTFDSPLEVRTNGPDDHLELTLHNRGRHALRGLFAIRVEHQTIRFGALADLAPGLTRGAAIDSMLDQPLSLERGLPQAKEAVVGTLVKAGLYPKEAWAMVNTWEKGYFRTDGLRVLCVFPRETVDALIPIQITPAPDQLVRVMVGRTEVLTPDVERRIEKHLVDLGANDFQVREAASAALGKLGRLAEPALRRVAAVTQDLEVRKRAERLIAEAAAKE